MQLFLPLYAYKFPAPAWFRRSSIQWPTTAIMTQLAQRQECLECSLSLWPITVIPPQLAVHHHLKIPLKIPQNLFSKNNIKITIMSLTLIPLGTRRQPSPLSRTSEWTVAWKSGAHRTLRSPLTGLQWRTKLSDPSHLKFPDSLNCYVFGILPLWFCFYLLILLFILTNCLCADQNNSNKQGRIYGEPRGPWQPGPPHISTKYL